MKILIVTPIFPPETRGPATYTSELVSRLARQEVGSKVITFTQSPIAQNGISIYSVPVTGGTFLRQGRLFMKILEWGRSTDIIYAQGADVVGFISCLAGKILGKPVVIKFVGDLSVEMGRDFHKKVPYLSLITKISLVLADKIIFPADHLRQNTVKKYGVGFKKTTVIYNAI